MNWITNEHLTVGIKRRGAELCSIKSTDGFEYIWQADPAVWARHAPVLFPIVGRLRAGRYTLNGKTYELPQHGFARDMDFTLIDRDEHTLIFQLLPTAGTRARYPFEFALTISYRLNGPLLTVEYKVQNCSKETMPFSIGAHPAFNLAAPIEQCRLEFERQETLNTWRLSGEELLANETEPVLQNSRILPLSRTIFNRDALIFMDAVSDRITLCTEPGSRRIAVEFPGFPQLGIWAKPGAPFVCIEPWYGYVDPDQPYGDIMNKPGILQLEAGKTFTCEHRISVEQ